MISMTNFRRILMCSCFARAGAAMAAAGPRRYVTNAAGDVVHVVNRPPTDSADLPNPRRPRRNFRHGSRVYVSNEHTAARRFRSKTGNLIKKVTLSIARTIGVTTDGRIIRDRRDGAFRIVGRQAGSEEVIPAEGRLHNCYTSKDDNRRSAARATGYLRPST
jgi:hypothetical protein